MKFNHINTAAFLMQAVNVLGNDSGQQSHFLQAGKSQVSSIGIGINHIKKFCQHLPDFRGIIEKCSEGAVFKRIVSGPQAIFAAKVRDTAFSAYSCSGNGGSFF